MARQFSPDDKDTPCIPLWWRVCPSCQTQYPIQEISRNPSRIVQFKEWLRFRRVKNCHYTTDNEGSIILIECWCGATFAVDEDRIKYPLYGKEGN